MVTSNRRPIKTRISPDILDTIGKSFKFKHGKGIAEWLKNALDQYLRLVDQGNETLSGNWPVFINLVDAPSQSKGPNLVVLDFGGTTYEEVKEFFLHWGDKSAASHGGNIATHLLTGGHGNGGKFYMREMWRDGARFLTWKNGKTTSLIVKKMKDGSTGLFELENETMSWMDALRFALDTEDALGGIDGLIDFLADEYPQIIKELDNSVRGFSAVVGRRAVQIKSSNDVVVGGRWKHQQLIDDIREAQQARRPIRELAISIFVNGELQIRRLSPQSVENDPEWQPRSYVLSDQNADVEQIGLLQIYKSINPLTGRMKDFNTLFITDAYGNPIAFYPIYELPFVGHSPIMTFIGGELQLLFPAVADLVTNDRERLVDSPLTQEILQWAADRIWEFVQEIEKTNQEKRQKQNLDAASKLNDALNKHAKNFLKRVQLEIMVDYVPGETGGGPGGGGEGEGGTQKGHGGTGQRDKGRGGGHGSGGDIEEIGQDKIVRRYGFPKMLLSGYDMDPSTGNQKTKLLTDRHPPLYQDDVDRVYNVWWLNTSHPFAAKAIKMGGPNGHAFKSHHLSMFRDMVQREALRILQRRESELPLDRIENELDEISNRFLAELPWDLVETLLK